MELSHLRCHLRYFFSDWNNCAKMNYMSVTRMKYSGWKAEYELAPVKKGFQVQPTDKSSITSVVPYMHVCCLCLFGQEVSVTWIWCLWNVSAVHPSPVCWTSAMLGWALCRQHSRDLYLVHWWNNPVLYRVSVDWPFGRGRWPVIYNCTTHSDDKYYKHLSF